MITCQHAQHLFDSYLDGSLSANLQTELHAHRLGCTACQNELALLEACGDVIAMDRREPRISVAFTDRVLLAQRGRQSPQRRRWGRALWLVGSPMAAAASLAFTLFVIMPPVRVTPKTRIAHVVETPSAEIRNVLLHQAGRELTADEKREIAQAREIPAVNLVEWFLAPIVERSRSTLEGTRRGAEELELLMRSFSNTNEVLVARWRSMEQEKKAAAAALPERVSDFDPLDPSYLSQPPAVPDSPNESEWTEQAEAL